MKISDLEKSDSSSVWVENKSNPRGIVNMSMSDGSGNNIVVTVPVTHIPVDLTTQATKSAIVSSPMFRRMVTMTMLEIISEDEAMQKLSTPEAKKEAQRIYDWTQSIHGGAEIGKVEIPIVEEGISGFAMSLAELSDMDEDQVMSMLRGNEDTLSAKDWKYLAERSTYLKVKSLAAEHLV